MKKIITDYLIFLLLVSLTILFFNGCSDEPTPSLYDPNLTSGAQPVITSVNPPGSALAGVSEITITGNNFSPVKEYNFVFFNSSKATVLEASTTMLKVLAPKVVSDTVIIKIAVHGAELFSENFMYQLKPSVAEYYAFDATLGQKPYGITLDANENLYVSLIGLNVSKITPDKVMSLWAPKGTETQWNSMQYGPSNTIYAAKLLRGVWKINEGVAPTNVPWVAAPTGASIFDMDFDNNHNIWAVGSNTTLANNSIVLMKQDATLKSFIFPHRLRAVRYFNGKLYFAGLINGKEAVWNAVVEGDSIHSFNLYFNYSDNVDSVSIINAITFSADGDLYIATNKTVDPITIVHSDGSYEPLYPGNFDPKTNIIAMAWGNGVFLYVTRAEYIEGTTVKLKQTVLAVNMQKNGAVYYGRN